MSTSDDLFRFGISVTTLSVKRKPPKGDPIWKDITKSYVNREVNVMDLANLVYGGHMFAPMLKSNYRNTENFLKGQHLAVDADHFTIKELLKDPFIKRYAALLYSTFSHTEEDPRSRVVFVLDTPIHQVENYRSALSTLLFHYPSFDQSCKDPCRGFYGSYHCQQIEVPMNVLPLSAIRSMINVHVDFQKAMERRRPAVVFDDNPNLEEAAEALQRIDPWKIEYHEWVKLLAALYHSFGDAALPVAERWADGDGNEVAVKWKSFKGSSAGKQATVASVFEVAKRFGWRSRQPQA